MTTTEAVAIRQIVLDMFERGEVVFATWLASQYAEALEVAGGVASLVDDPLGAVHRFRLVYTRRGLVKVDWLEVQAANRDAIREAFATMRAAGGGVVHLPPGIYPLRSVGLGLPI